MVEDNVDTLENQNTDTGLEDVNDTSVTDSDTISNDDNSDTHESDTEVKEESSDDSDEDITDEQLEALSDDEFAEYLNTGKLPSTKKEEPKPDMSNARIISKPEKKTTDKNIDTKQEQKTEVDINYKSAYESIFAPFKANGKTITPRTVEDVISLMQMGANYTKKMQLLAPMKKTVESLNKANISEEDLNFLIDIHNGDTEAIKQLLQKHKVDPMELDLDDTKYVPNKKNIASEQDVEFSDMLMDINSSLPKIQEIMEKTWDARSKAKLMQDPKYLQALHEEIELGRFDEVQKRVELERTFGRYKNVSDLEAYIDVVTKMVAEQSKQSKTTSTKPESKTTTKEVPDKSKAAPTKSKPKSQGAKMTVSELLSMSDEEFNKLSINDLY